MPRSNPANGYMARRSPRARRQAVKSVRSLWHCCEPVERRLVLSMPDWGILAPLIPTFDRDVEQREAARLAAEDGPEATSIVWANRGTTDNFGTVFGTSATAARNVVDAALDSWERVITNWNRSDGTITLQVNISMATTGSGFGASGGPDATAPADGKPRTGGISLGRGNLSADPNDSNGWFLDLTPFDNSEFLGNLDHAFCGTAPGPLGGDLFSVVAHELTHVMGMISDPNNAGGSWQGYLLENHVTNTGIVDNAEGGGLYGHFYAFDGPTIDHLMTSYNSGDATAASWGNVAHTAGPGANINWGGRNWRGVDELGNAIYNFDQRTPPDFALAHILSDAYGYTIVEPARFGTFYATLIQSTGELLVRGPTGTANSGDVIVVSSSGGEITVSVDAGVDVPGTGALPGAGNLPAWVSVFNAASVSSINVYGGDGVDAIRIEGNAGRPVRVYGDAGDDYLDLSYYAGNLGNITGAVSMYGGAGNDTMWVYDDYVATPFTYSIDSAYVNRPGFGGAFYGSDVEGLTVATSSGADTINVPSTYSVTPLTIRTSGGYDTVNLGNASNGVRSIVSDVAIENVNSYTLVNVNNAADTTGRNATMSNDGTWGRITGLAPAGIYWKQADVQTVNVTGGTGADTFNLLRTSEGVSYDGTSGLDTVNIGEANSTAYIAGTGVSLRNVSSYNTVNVSNSATGAAQTVSLGRANLDGIIFGVLSGLAPATISYRYNDTSDVNLTLGTGADTLNVLATGGIGVTTIDGRSGGDVVNVGDAGLLDNIAARLVLRNTSSYSTVNINDSADATADTITVLRQLVGSDEYARVAGMAPAAIDYRLNDVSDVTLSTGTAGDTVQVGITGGIGDTTLTSAGGNDTVRVGGVSLYGASLIAAPLYILNPPAFTALTVDDAADTVGRIVSIDVTTGTPAYHRISGIAPANIYTRVGDFSSPATIEAGSGADTFNIRGTAGSPSFAIRGNAGHDAFVVGDATNKVDPSNSALTVDGGSGSNTLTFNDQDNTVAQGFTVTATTIAHPAMGTVTYSNLDRVTVNGTSVAATHTVNGTAPATNVAVNTGPAGDTVNVVETGFPSGVSLGGSLAGDTIRVNSDNTGVANATLSGSASLVALDIGTGGFVTMTQNGSSILRAGLLGIRGRLDIADNAVIADYAGLYDPVYDYRTLLANGYNGGAWNGAEPAIVSTMAATLARSNDAVGFAQPAYLGNPAQWLGQTIDPTTMLIRYTLYGDVNLDRAVNIGDFSSLGTYFNATNSFWAKGDFNYDRATNIGDFSLMAANFNTSLPAATPAAGLFGRTPIGEGLDALLA